MNTAIRRQFPSLKRKFQGKLFRFLDGPAGTQVPESVISAISDYYRQSNSNSHGYFPHTRETDHLLETTRQKVADFLNAEGGHTISYGQNMTSLNFSLSKAIGRCLQPGDEILITQLDHESNRGPWLALRSEGIVVREIVLRKDGTLDYDDLATKLNERTRLVAMGWASNIFGTVNEVRRVRQLTHQVGAWLLLDAVHYAPHLSIDVQAVGCDFLLCSAYKFYGPHVGLLYCKPGLLDRLQPDRLRTTEQHAPYCIETGTLNHAAIAGVGAAIDFIAALGKGKSYRDRLVDALERIHQHEISLAIELYDGLREIKHIRLYGPPMRVAERAPTLSFYHDRFSSELIGQYLANHHVGSWSGHFYAVRATEVLGLAEKGGVTRLGISIYNTQEDVHYVLKKLKKMK